MPFLGDRFRAAREARGLTLADVSEQIHIRTLYLDCIEREDWPAIGAPVYTRGFVRSYARYLGLEPEQAVAEYAQSSGNPVTAPTAALAAQPPGPAPRVSPPREIAPRGSGPKPPPRKSAPPPKKESSPRRGASATSGGPSPAVYILGFVALMLVGAVGYSLFDSGAKAGHTTAVATPAPVASAQIAQATATPTSRPTPITANTLAFTVNARSWVQIAIDGQQPVAATLEPGTTKTFHGKTAVLRVGNAGGVVVTVDGKSLGPLGASGAVVERAFTL